MMNSEERTAILQELSATLQRRRLGTPARLLLDVIEPMAFFAGQAAQFARPLTPFGRWRTYLAALDDEEGWKILHTLVDR